MNLYLIERTDQIGYDEYNAFVVHAPTPEAVEAMISWHYVPDTPPTVKLIGVAADDLPHGVVLGSFNAG